MEWFATGAGWPGSLQRIEARCCVRCGVGEETAHGQNGNCENTRRRKVKLIDASCGSLKLIEKNCDRTSTSLLNGFVDLRRGCQTQVPSGWRE